MALHSELSIYKATYDLLGVVVDAALHMRRDVKQAIGGKIRDETLALVVLIYKANVARDKTPYLAELLERLQVVSILLRVSRDKAFIATKQYAAAIRLADSIGRQATGWKKSAKAPVA